MTKLLFIVAASLAACVSTATAGDWYASIYGGVNRNSVIELPFVKDETGHVIGGTVGKGIAAIPGLRIEVDLSHRSNDVEVFSSLTANHETTGLLFNVAYDFTTNGPVKPYLLVGAGYAHTQATFESISLLRLEASDLAFQLGAGAQAPLFPGARIGIGYRYFQGPVIEVFGTELSDGVNHSLIGTLSFDL